MLELIWVLTLTVCGSNGACVSQVIDEWKDQDACLAKQVEYIDFPRDRNPRWKTIKYECKIKGGMQT